MKNKNYQSAFETVLENIHTRVTTNYQMLSDVYNWLRKMLFYSFGLFDISFNWLVLGKTNQSFS